MLEIIEFAEVESEPGRMKQVAFRKGDRPRVEVRPAPSERGLAAAVSLHLADGTTARRVPLARIASVKGRARAA